MIIAKKKAKITPKAVPVKAKKAPTKAKAKKAPKKPAKGKTLKELVLSWDDIPELHADTAPSLYSVASRMDEHCNRLSEIKHLMDAALEDFFDLSDSRSTNLICLADRLLRDALKEAEGITVDLYAVNRNALI